MVYTGQAFDGLERLRKRVLENAQRFVPKGAQHGAVDRFESPMQLRFRFRLSQDAGDSYLCTCVHEEHPRVPVVQSIVQLWTKQQHHRTAWVEIGCDCRL
jgi:hypothetical protein